MLGEQDIPILDVGVVCIDILDENLEVFALVVDTLLLLLTFLLVTFGRL
jgi:hypothetical protein